MFFLIDLKTNPIFAVLFDFVPQPEGLHKEEIEEILLTPKLTKPSFNLKLHQKYAYNRRDLWTPHW